MLVQCCASSKRSSEHPGNNSSVVVFMHVGIYNVVENRRPS